MKKDILFLTIVIVAVLCNLTVGAQPYMPMLGTKSNIWDIQIRDNPTGSADPQRTGYYYVRTITGGDTIIGGKSFRKIYAHGYYPEEYGGREGLFGFIREDTAAKKVYFLAKDSSEEILEYDFNLHKGDSMYFHIYPHHQQGGMQEMYPLSGYYKVTKEDTVIIENVRRKRLQFVEAQPSHMFYWSKAFIWVEGIGSMKNPVYTVGPTTRDYPDFSSAECICAWKDSVKVLNNGKCNIKNADPNGVRSAFRMDRTLNPPYFSGGQWHLLVQKSLVSRVTVFDITGRQVQVSFFHTGEELIFRIPPVPGVYVLYVSGPSGSAAVKFIQTY